MPDVSFEEVVKPVIKWLNDHSHPNAKIIIECDKAELVEGQQTVVTNEFIKD
jgi:hypothetical protein